MKKLILFLTIFSAGCASSMYGKSRQSNLFRINPGSSESQVYETMGNPNGMEFSGDNKVLHYKVWIDDGSLMEKNSWYTIFLNNGYVEKVFVNNQANINEFENNVRMQQGLQQMSEQFKAINKREPSNISNGTRSCIINGTMPQPGIERMGCKRVCINGYEQEICDGR